MANLFVFYPLIFVMISSNVSDRSLKVFWFKAPIPYRQAWSWQRSLFEARREDPQLDDVLLLLEHPPVYTLGRGANLAFLQFTPTETTPEVHRIERGGEVTYHCPGQLVGYPILNLKRHQPDLHWYLRQLEQVIIETLTHFGIQGERVAGLTGVWADGAKVAAIGIQVSRWITRHGFALNVCPDLRGFRDIVPCGIADRPVGSLAQLHPNVTVAEAIEPLVAEFARGFDLNPSLQVVEVEDSQSWTPNP